MYKENLEELISLIDEIEAGIVKSDASPNFKLTFMNNGFLRLIGYTKEEFETECDGCLAPLIHSDDISDVRQAQKVQLKQVEPVSVEVRFIRKDKSIIWVLLKSKLSKTENGECEGTLVLTDITHIKQVELELKINEKILSFAVNQSNIIILKYDPTTDTMFNAHSIMPKYFNPAVVNNFTAEVLKYGHIFPDDIKAFLAIFKAVQRGDVFSQGTFRVYGCDEVIIWYNMKIASILDNKGRPLQCVVAMEDITEIRRLADENEFRKSMVSDSSFAYEANITKNTVTFVEQKIIDNHPHKSFLCFTDLVKHFLIYYIHKDFAVLFAHFCNKKTIIDIIDSGRNQNSIEYRRFSYDDNLYHWYKNTMNIIRDRTTGEIKIRCYTKDIDDEKQREFELKYKSERDLLSGMYNKMTAEEKISNYISMCKHTNERCALFLIDIDKFKEINDRFGHGFGDAVISEASKRIMESFRDNDVIGRVGGDEFVILMRNIDSEESVKNKARQLCENLHKTYVDEFIDDIVSVSIGIAILPDNGICYDELCRNADIALYASKDNGRNCYTMYNKTLERKSTISTNFFKQHS